MFTSHALVAVAGYLIGSVPFGYLFGRLKGLDVRRYGSGGTGGTNVLRTVGLPAAVATGVLDLLKGTLSAWIGGRFGGDWGYTIGVLAAMVGHSYPVWLGFRGGKSVATGAGGLLLRHPLPILAALALAVACIWPTRYVSLGSIVSGIALGLYLVFTQPLPGQVLGLAAAAMILWRHRSNIQRLLAGTENKLGQKSAPRRAG